MFNSKYTGQQVETLLDSVEGKQENLVSGTNIKTINGQSILGNGDLQISGGATYTAGEGIEITADNVIKCTVGTDEGYWDITE